VPRIEQLVTNREYVEAFDLATRVSATAGSDEVPDTLWQAMSRRVSVVSEPSGAMVAVQPFSPDAPWTVLGPTPLEDVRVPRGILRWRVEHNGHATAEHVGFPSANRPLSFVLSPEGSAESTMVRVPGGNVSLWALAGVHAAPSVPVGDFLLDRFEVSNAEFARFVDGGGYEREELWVHEFRDGDSTWTFDEAMERVRDSTGRPGPATWAFGSYPEGQGDYPVGGISWYEAEAYAAFMGKELPTVYHWYLADNGNDLQTLPGLLLPRGNFRGEAARSRDSSDAVSAYGAYEMAGNMREWTANASGDGRLALGGAWTDPTYIYLIPQAPSPMDRSPGNGFRTMKVTGDVEDPDLAWGPLPRAATPDPRDAVPVSDETFSVFTRFFDSEPLPLAPIIVEEDDSSPHWTRQRISYAAGYGDDRVTVLLYLPRNAQPPYQTIIYMGGAGSFSQRPSTTEALIESWSHMEYLIRGGRAVLFPLWKGSYERGDGYSPLGSGAAAFREKTIQWVKELRQSIDYLETRADIDADKVGFQGTSFGALMAPILLALEPRLKTGILLQGGFLAIQAASTPLPPEIDAVNYAPRVRVPVLMMNGRYDAIFPYETSQLPLLRALGTPDSEKRHLTFESAHSSYGWTTELYREGLGWLDEIFGEPAR
jgi:formylglycine-generating enzyme required for sulfatase activity/dienelactone hydrolase